MKYQRKSATSKEAATRIEPANDTLRAEVYAVLIRATFHGATDEEIQNTLEMAGSTERPRRIELVEAGLVIDSQRQRKTRSGRNAVVWIATRFVEAQAKLFA